RAARSGPGPPGFGGPVGIRRSGDKKWTDVPLTHGNIENCRGIGLADMARALRTGLPHRADGEVAFHVLDAMQGFLDASRTERHVILADIAVNPAPLRSDDAIQLGS